MQNDYPLAQDKLEIKREILHNYQLKIADDYNIPVGNVKKLGSNLFGKDKYLLHYKNLQLYVRLRLKIEQDIVN